MFELVFYAKSSGKAPIMDWLDALDKPVKARVQERILRMAIGQLGDAKSLSAGLFEVKFNFGLRVYYGFCGPKIILLLNGGDKSTQWKDIEKAREYLKDYRRRYEAKKAT